MLASWLVSAVLALAPFATAQNSLLPIVSSGNLRVTFDGSNVVDPPGERIPRADTATPPTFFMPANVTTSSTTTTGILMMIDLDVARNNTRVALLHWLAPDMTLTKSSNGTTVVNTSAGAAPYRQPTPPAGDSPHRYVFMLFAQPADFAVPSAFMDVLQTRVPFDYKGFINATNIGMPMAANYITVQNTSAPATPTTFPPDATAAATAGGNGTASGGAGAATATGTDSSGSSATNGGSSASQTSGSTQSTGAAAKLEAASTLGTMAGAALGVLGLLSYAML